MVASMSIKPSIIFRVLSGVSAARLAPMYELITVAMPMETAMITP